MNSTAKTALIDLPTASSWHAFLGDLAELTKARLTFLVLVTTLAGFYLAGQGGIDFTLLFNTLLGTTLIAAAAASLNQYLERGVDAKMHRTKDRPLVKERLAADEVVVLSVSAAVIGAIYLSCLVHALTAALALASFAIYLFVYTPAKMKSPTNTLIGAIPGALPPLIGWSAVQGVVNWNGFLLFLLLFLWQMPHFMAIAWLYRDEYAAAGFKMMPLYDASGRLTARQALVYALFLVPVSLLCAVLFRAAIVYLFGAAILSGLFVWQAWKFWCLPERLQARRLFFASIIYLPLQLGWMAVVKVWWG